MKIIVLGDTHGRNIWKSIINNESFDKVVFVGDYFDSIQIKTEDQVNNFLDIIQFKKDNPDKVILLIGNHDHHYFQSIEDTGTSGYQQIGQYMITPVLEDNKEYLQMAYSYDNFLFTHAGVSEVFMNDCFGKDGWSFDNIANDLNELWKYKPKAFIFNGYNSSGDNIEQTPIWIRPRSLMAASKAIKKQNIIQIVGHTSMSQIDIKGKSTGGKYFFIDTIETSKEYLIIDNEKITCKKAIL